MEEVDLEESELAQELNAFEAAVNARELFEARNIANRILSSQLFNENQQDYFNVLNKLAKLESSSGSPDGAIEYYLDIIELGKENEIIAWQAHGFKHIGMINSQLLELERAEVYLTKALDIYRLPEFQNSLPLANTLREIALLQKRKYELQTQNLWEEAMDIYKENNSLVEE